MTFIQEYDTLTILLVGVFYFMTKKLWDKFNKKEVKELYIKQRIPLSGIAHRFGVSHKTMKKFFVKNNITIQGRIFANPLLMNKKWLAEHYYSGKGIQKMADMADTTRGNIYYALRKANITLRSGENKNNPYIKNPLGVLASNYKGGRRKSGANGRYIQILSHGHPFTDQDGYVQEHRLVMEKNIGRYLTKDEIVHHLDGNGHNNDISNLELTTKKKHFKDHFDAVKLIKPLQNEITYLKKLLMDNNIAF